MKHAGGISIDWIALSHQSNVPLFQQLCSQLRNAVLSGQLAADDRLPSSRVLAAECGVSRNTVITAYQQLIAEGYFHSRTGAGTRVSASLPHAGFGQQSGGDKPDDKPPIVFRGTLIDAVQYSGAFSPSLPAIDAFPYATWRRINNRLWRDLEPSQWMGYGDPAGYLPLRRCIASHLQNSRGVNCTEDQILVVSGSQQALDLVARLLIDKGDSVWFEEPGYAGARDAFRYAGASLVPISVDENGFDIESAIQTCSNARMAFVTPSHQYPLGSVLSLERRVKLLEWARDNQSWIVEDDYNSDFRYVGRPLMSLQGLDTTDRAIYMGTFSKILFPALRVGYLVLPKQLVKKFVDLRQATDGFAPTFTQAVLAEFMRQGHFDSHLRRMRKLYAQRQQALLNALQPLSDFIDVQTADSGMHLVARLRVAVADTEIAARAADSGITLLPLSTYYMADRSENGFILGYAGFEKEVMHKGVDVIRGIIDRALNNLRAC